MRSALDELDLGRIDVIHAGSDSYDLADRIRAVAATRLHEEFPPRRLGTMWGTASVRGDIVSPAASEDDWEVLRS